MPASYEIAANQTAVQEGNFATTPFTFTVTRTDGTLAETINYALTGDIIANDIDGGVLNGVVSFGIGETVKIITVLVRGDQAFEANEQFTVTLSGPSNGGSTIATAAASSTILNDDQTIYSNVSFTLPNGAVSLELLGFDNINGTGNAGNNFIRGNEGSNILEGLEGDDSLFGGLGRDAASYLHASAGVNVDIRLSGWQDTVGAGSDRLNSIEDLIGSNFNDKLYGSVGTNVLYGNDGNDLLDGGQGGDKMYGGQGDDDYYVDSTADFIGENFNEGNDDVFSSVTYTLRANIENLFLTGSDAINGTGNNGNNYLSGNAGANVLEGGAGDDTIIGGSGRDTASYEHANWGVNVSLNAVGRQNTGGAGADLLSGIENLRGSAFADTLTGTNSAGGGNGENVLTGLGGADKFVFFKASINGLDRITDFSSAEGDKLVFKGSDYGFSSGEALTPGVHFFNASTAQGNDAQFYYNAANHTLYWDGDGAQSGVAPIKLAVLDGVGSLAASDFLFT